MKRTATQLMMMALLISAGNVWSQYGGGRTPRGIPPGVKALQKHPMVVVTNDEVLYNTFRSRFPDITNFEFVRLNELAQKAHELEQTQKVIIYLVDRSRGNFPLEQRHLIGYDLHLIRRQDVVIAGWRQKVGKKSFYRALLSAPSFYSLSNAIDAFLRSDELKMKKVWQVPLIVVVTNAGQEVVNAFGETVHSDYIWVTVERIAAVDDLLVTETEVYILLAGEPGVQTVNQRLPFEVALLRDTQSVVARQSKGGNFYRVLYYSPYLVALRHLVRQYRTLTEIPEQPQIVTHPDFQHVKKVLVVPFADVIEYRQWVREFDQQALAALQNARLFDEVEALPQKEAEDPERWQQWREGQIPIDTVQKLCKDYDAQLLITGRLLSFEPRTILREAITDIRPTPAADRKIYHVSKRQEQNVTATLEVRIFDGETGKTVWVKQVQGVANVQSTLFTRSAEGTTAPPLSPDEVRPEIANPSLYQSAAVEALGSLISALRGETILPGAVQAAQPAPAKEMKLGRGDLATPAPLLPKEKRPTLTGEVTQVEGEFIYIDLGKGSGVEEGMEFVVVRQKEITTARKKTVIEEPIAVIKVVAVFDEVSRARRVGDEGEVVIKPGDKVKLVLPPAGDDKTAEEAGGEEKPKQRD